MTASHSALANPTSTDLTVVSGSISTATSGNTFTITQSSDRALVNAKTFDIASGETTKIDQQKGSSSLFVARVTSSTPTSIYGSLLANGHVTIINPNGMLIGNGANIDTAGFVATTADMKDNQLNQTQMKFNKAGAADAKIEIADGATITIRDKGLALFVAPTVQNDGIIQGDYAKVQLAAADTFVVDMYGDGLLSFAADDTTARTLKAENNGWISADAGKILMTAADASGLIDSVINNTGTLRAHSLTVSQGEIVLAGKDAAINVSGTLDASGCAVTGTCTGGPGGTISVGDKYTQGNKTIGMADTATVTSTGILKADATSDGGNGGKITVTSKTKTSARGTFSAKASATGGNGGRIETASKGILDVDGAKVDASAAAGDIGEWYIAADDMQIENAGGMTGAKSYIDASALGNANANLTLRSQNDIVFDGDINIINPKVNVGLIAGKEGGNAIKYTINGTLYKVKAASGNIDMNGHYIRTVSGDVSMLAGGTIYIKDSLIYLKGINGGLGGDLSLVAGDITLDGAGLYTRGGDVLLSATAAGGLGGTTGTLEMNGSTINTTALAGTSSTIGGIHYDGLGPVDIANFEDPDYENTFVQDQAGGKITFSGTFIDGMKNCFAAGGSGCYVPDPMKQTDLTITTQSTSKTYGDADPTLNANVSGALYGDTWTVGTVTRASGEDASTYAISASGYSIDGVGNYKIVYDNSGVLTIKRATLTVYANPASMTVGGTVPALTYYTLPSDYKYSDTEASVVSGALSHSGSTTVIGVYQVTQGTLAVNSNYTLNFVPAAFTVNAFATPASARIYPLPGLGRPELSYGNNVLVNNLPFKGYEVQTMGTNVSIKMASNQGTAAALNAIAPAAGGEMSPEQLNAMAPAAGGNGNDGISCGNDFLDNKPCKTLNQ